ACVRLGAVTNPLMPIFRARELEFMLAFANTKAIVIPREFRGFAYEPLIDGLRAQLPDLEHVFVVGGEGDNAFEPALSDRPWEEEVDDLDAILAAGRPEPNDVIEYCYTSGTSGQPKAVMHTSNTLVSCIEGAFPLNVDASTVVLMGSPLAHQTGFIYGMLMPFVLGGRAVFMDIWNVPQAVRLIHDQQVTLTMGATPFLSDLTESNLLERYPPDSLQIFICAGAPIPRPLVRAGTERLGASIVAGWGMSENGLVSATLCGDPEAKVLGTDGVPCPGMELRVVDDDKQVVANGIDGQLQVRGAANFVGYLKRPEAYSVDAEGWFDTGDIARMDDDGYITITGRAKDILIRGGENVPVAEVESALFDHPAVAKVAVVGKPDPRLGERGCAFVTLNPGHAFGFDDMVEHLSEADFTKNYWPEHLVVLDEMPMTPSGKIQKFKLRDLAATE
ncbi:MAG: AMP-binding protein, partial [Pseudomonadota bacterium]